ncbi:MAG: SDR family NAD(P)-dependent oxidoreductase [Sporichthyaceae bacterium]
MAGVQDRVIVVTGAGNGLGREYALTLAAGGSKVVVNDLGGSRDGTGGGSSAADAVVAEIAAAGGQAVANYDSVSTEAGGAAIVQTALDAYGRIDGVIANAGILRDRAFHKLSAEDWDAVLQVHLYGTFHTIRAAWPHLREQQHGRIVVATSTSGIFGNFGQANYGAAKAGMIGLINTLAIEGRKANVLANAVAPMAATRMTEDIAPAEVLAALPPAHVAPVVGHLCSDELTDSGQVFVVGGGRVYRVAQFQSKGVTFADVPSIADVASRWSEITDLGGADVGRNPVG